MTTWADVAIGGLLGGVSEVLGKPIPLSPNGGGAGGAAITDRGDLSMSQRAALKYMGVDPDTASLDEINRVLELGPKAPTVPAAAPPPPPPGPATPPAPGTPPPDGMSGPAAEAAKTLNSALEKNHSALNDADDQLSEAILKATTSSQDGQQKLKALQQDIIDKVDKLKPTLDTPAGQQQLAEFLQGKADDINKVLKDTGLNSQAHSAILDALAAQYKAVKDGKGSGPDDGKGGKDDPQTPAAPGAPAPGGPASPAPDAPPAGPSGTGGLPGSDPLLDGGLPSDPMMAGLGALGPAMGALGGLPGALGSMMPGGGLGGGGGGLGDLGSAIGGAIHDANSHSDNPDPAEKQHPDPLKDPGQENKPQDPNGPKNPQTEPAGNNPQGPPAAGPGQAPPAGAPGAPGQVPAPPPFDPTVKLPGDTTRTVNDQALNGAGRDVLAGKSIDEAFPSHGIVLPPIGSPVTNNQVSPGSLQFGDMGEFTDHRVMALGQGTVWNDGQVVPLSHLQTGPNFLGWHRLTTPGQQPTAPVAPPPVAAPPPVSGATLTSSTTPQQPH